MKNVKMAEDELMVKEIKKENLILPYISVILTLHDSELYISEMLDKLMLALQDYNSPFEVICVDNGSVDKTEEIIKAKIKEQPNLKLVKLRSSFGEASAIDAGLNEANGHLILYVTARVGVNLSQIGALIKKIEDGYELVVGWREPRHDSKMNQIISKGFNFILKRLTSLKLHDINSGVFIAKRVVFENISIYGALNIFIPILALQQGYKIAEQKIEQLELKYRTSRYFSEYIQRFLDIINVVFLTKYSKKPIHFLGFLGALLSLSGLIINIYLLIYRWFFGPIAGRPLLLLGALLLVIGIQMVSIGLIGEMIIFTHAKEVKEYNIEEIITNETDHSDSLP